MWPIKTIMEMIKTTKRTAAKIAKKIDPMPKINGQVKSAMPKIINDKTITKRPMKKFFRVSMMCLRLIGPSVARSLH